jgi:hypothetical protein
MIYIESFNAETARAQVAVAASKDPRIGGVLTGILHRIDDASRAGKTAIDNPFALTWSNVTWDHDIATASTEHLTEREMDAIVRVLRSKGFTIDVVRLSDGKSVKHCPYQRVTW